MQKPELDEDQRAAAARVTAAIEASGAGADLAAITRDRIVLGDVLGDHLSRVVEGTQADTIASWPVLELLRAAGADEERAAAKSAWLRHTEATTR